MHRDTIRIANLDVKCVVGIYPDERTREQLLRADLALELDLEDAGATGNLASTIDYADVAAHVAFILRAGRFRLLETAAHVICKYLLVPPAPAEHRPRLERVRIRLEKPEALGGRAIPSLEVERTAAWATLRNVPTEAGSVDVLHDNREVRVAREHVAPGRGLTLGDSEALVVTGGFASQGKTVSADTTFARGDAVRLENPTAAFQTFLSVRA